MDFIKSASYNVPANVSSSVAKGQGAKEIGHNLACEQPKFGRSMKTWAQICKHFQAFLHQLSENTKTAISFCR